MWYKKILLCVSIVAMSGSGDVYAAARGERYQEGKCVKTLQRFDGASLFGNVKALLEKSMRADAEIVKEQARLRECVQRIQQEIVDHDPKKRRSSCPSLLKTIPPRIKYRRASSSQYYTRLGSKGLMGDGEDDNKQNADDSTVTLKDLEYDVTIFGGFRGYATEREGRRCAFFHFGKSDRTMRWLSLCYLGKKQNTDMVEVVAWESHSRPTFWIDKKRGGHEGRPVAFIDEIRLTRAGVPFIVPADEANKMLRRCFARR